MKSHHKVILSLLFCMLGFSSCALLLPNASTFPLNDIRLGATMEDVKNRCGTPFRSDIFMKNNKKIEVLYYKEPALVKVVGFIITTALTFENDTLTSIIQNEKMISDVEISVDSLRRR